MTDDNAADARAARIAAAIGEPARARMLYRLLDGRARTSTELAALAEVAPSTASAHLTKLTAAGLVRVQRQGKHRYFSLAGVPVARALEALSVAAGGDAAARPAAPFAPTTPDRLRHARTCYDHIAGSVGVRIHDVFRAHRWLAARGDAYTLTAAGARACAAVRMDVAAARAARRRFAYPCLDWSERRPHIGGALGAALLATALAHRWLARDLDSRILTATPAGAAAMARWLDTVF